MTTTRRRLGCDWGTLRRLLSFVGLMTVAAPSFAQAPPYIAGAAGVDVSRFRHIEGLATQAEGEGTVFSLRLGTPLGARWGVELAFSRPTVVTETALFPVPFNDRLSVSSARRNTTLDTVVWVTQRASARVDLVYLGGVAFARVVADHRVFDRFPIPGFEALSFDISLRTLTYGVGPLVGAEARIEVTDHLFLVPGVRLLSVGAAGDGGWILRATTGLGWQF